MENEQFLRRAASAALRDYAKRMSEGRETSFPRWAVEMLGMPLRTLQQQAPKGHLASGG
ncbi:hypothetical protein SAMN06265795_1038 [Noviherbaspirillum humi]|uniref:Uncharacterized protein n=1 Tax=Noviherbaspirillum humi TaxID=1688639 RepID=A0A239ETE7_9BURK|nr:hypothetical protein [Noviherbaspirillum humi]SNS47897.1 hypothetical protein SAMN06265795_1038 [Noviherbaspirillum humi]